MYRHNPEKVAVPWALFRQYHGLFHFQNASYCRLARVETYIVTGREVKDIIKFLGDDNIIGLHGAVFHIGGETIAIPKFGFTFNAPSISSAAPANLESISIPFFVVATYSLQTRLSPSINGVMEKTT